MLPRACVPVRPSSPATTRGLARSATPVPVTRQDFCATAAELLTSLRPACPWDSSPTPPATLQPLAWRRARLCCWFLAEWWNAVGITKRPPRNSAWIGCNSFSRRLRPPPPRRSVSRFSMPSASSALELPCATTELPSLLSALPEPHQPTLSYRGGVKRSGSIIQGQPPDSALKE